ncbi:putative bifunctional diguanylate cyclase/phosphodiesterase [Mycobacterium sp. C31M]
MPADLEVIVTGAATHLIAADAATSVAASTQVLTDLAGHFDVDISFLRHHDHVGRTSRLIARWPPETKAEPQELVHFADADSVFKLAENLKAPTVVGPGATQDHQRSVALAPLLSGDITTGVLGFTKTGGRSWTEPELEALMAIASLFAQVQARIAAEERLRFLAEHDDLTGLHNRRALMAHLDERLTPGRTGPVGCLFFDLDRLKAINDYLGHTAGDRFIRILADRLVQTAGPSMICRLGGDEFVVIPAVATDTATATDLARRLQAELLRQVSIDGEMVTRTVSIGVATGSPGHDTSSDLLRKADRAVLTAKSTGGNQVTVYSAAISLESEFRNEIELHLQSVIETDALFLRYLPEIDMRTGKILATEALVRWQHPTRGLLSPDSFIGVAESINLAGELGRWVLHTACAELARWRAAGAGSDIVLRVNVSPVQLVADGFVESVAATLAEFALPRGSLCLEITESMVVQDIETTRTTLAGLHDAGVQVAIDDFGTGYSVLSLLKSLPVDTLKIDKSFVRDLGANPGDLAIVRAIIALAEAFDLELVAEGVETEAAAVTLLHHGCHRAQGFLLSRPIPGEEMEALLRRGRVSVDFSVGRP